MWRYLADDSLIVLLGPGVNQDGERRSDVAGALAERFDLERASLSELAQQITMNEGPAVLTRAVAELARELTPSRVHRFLARLPQMATTSDGGRHIPLILTMNFDTALERAFEEAGEPYDLVVYVARGEHRGRFVHVADQRPAVPIDIPTAYGGLPIDESGVLARAVIVKLFGSVAQDLRSGGLVVSSDDLDNYRSDAAVEHLVPDPLSKRIRESHCLLLGHHTNDRALPGLIRSSQQCLLE